MALDNLSVNTLCGSAARSVAAMLQILQVRKLHHRPDNTLCCKASGNKTL